jgi:ferritin-like metal-binding protein YciE
VADAVIGASQLRRAAKSAAGGKDYQHFFRRVIMEMEELRDLYVEQLRDLYHAENQLVKALPKMAKAASDEQLKTAFLDHLEETKGHVERLTQVFERLGVKVAGKKCKAMEGLIAEGGEMIDEDAAPEVKDAGLIAAAQRVEHYEMAGYGTVRAYAKLLGDTAQARILQQTLDEEGAADKKLTQLAESVINIAAAHHQASDA